MNILLTAHGSRGDVYPMIALGEEFHRHGHEVTMLTQPTHRKRLEDAGLAGIYTSEDMREAMTSMGSDWKGVRRMMEWSQKSLEEEFTLLDEVSGKVDLIVCTNQEFSVASIAEWRDIPAFRLSYIPAIPGDHTPPLIPWQNLPKRVNRLIWKGFGAGLDSMCRTTVNSWRAAHGLSPVKSLTPHMTSVFLTLYGFSSTLAPPHASWDASAYRYCGYCFEKENSELNPDLQTFLELGPKPVYFGFGSVSIPDADGMTRLALEAAMEADCRLIISKGWTGLGKSEVLAERPGWATPDRVFVTGDDSHTALFPRVAGVCHHGGAGTIHRAARAGVPQLILPVFVDQHFWGRNIHEAGAGPKPILPKRLDAKALAGVFKEMTEGSSWADGTRSLKDSMAEDGGTSTAYSIIMEEVVSRSVGAA